MATRTVYTSTITVPVYASWKCEKCGETNFSVGVIVCKREASTTSWRNSKNEEARCTAENLAQQEWKRNALEIVVDPNNNAMAMRSDFFLQSTSCTKCGAKPKWDKNMRYEAWQALSFLIAIISGFAAFSILTSVVAWLLFVGSFSAFVFGSAIAPRYKKMMANLPKDYTPVIGSLNEELIEYASKFGKTIPTPDECIAIVQGYSNSVAISAETDSIVDAQGFVNQNIAEENNSIPCNFCRTCGSKLQADSGFCHKCGTEIIK